MQRERREDKKEQEKKTTPFFQGVMNLEPGIQNGGGEVLVCCEDRVIPAGKGATQLKNGGKKTIGAPPPDCD